MPTNATHASNQPTDSCPSVPGRITPAGEPLLDAERLDVFHLAVEFEAIAAGFAAKADAILRDQLLRASVSVVLNLSEGAGRRSRADKARFYFMARGSASESGAILHLLRARGVVTDAEYAASRKLIVRIVQMLSKLAARTR
jgi:four helix bundle protein